MVNEYTNNDVYDFLSKEYGLYKTLREKFNEGKGNPYWTMCYEDSITFTNNL